MNYLAHARPYLDDPYRVAGTALPDWMNVIDRRNKARRSRAEAMLADGSHDPSLMAVARGCVQHHLDDAWFHQQSQFASLCTHFAVQLRRFLGIDQGHQRGFVGHIVIELLLDAVLVERDSQLLDRYYAALQAIDPQRIVAAANLICIRPAPALQELIPRFIEVRFLEDYTSDTRLLYRLNGVMRRIGFPSLPPELTEWLSHARGVVRDAADDLLSPPGDVPR
ncbi:MAG: hypothetical protein KatS3mg111_0272 [Pirellulaceae bacterium]|nr:MAG: hypothetical protein KatS3mg111_0272 [Pirellulaceae bacterium]